MRVLRCSFEGGNELKLCKVAIRFHSLGSSLECVVALNVSYTILPHSVPQVISCKGLFVGVGDLVWFQRSKCAYLSRNLGLLAHTAGF